MGRRQSTSVLYGRERGCVALRHHPGGGRLAREAPPLVTAREDGRQRLRAARR